MAYKNKKWTFELCKAEALKYSRRSKWMRGNGSSYNIARSKGWFEECIKHMAPKHTATKWTFEICKQDALKCSTKVEWAKLNSSSLRTAYKKGWIDELTAHMNKSKSTNIHWTFELCKQEALKHKHRGDWENQSGSSYRMAKNHKWLDELCLHMVHKRRIWTLETCKAEALKYPSKKEWQKNNNSCYATAYKNNWVKECTAHMSPDVSKKIAWLFYECIEDGVSYKTDEEWKEKSINTYTTASKNGWLPHIEFLRSQK